METSTRTLNKSFLERIDWRLITIILILFGTSCLIINSAMSGGQYETNFLLKQILYAVSYTHLTLPTICSVQISVVAGSLKKKKKKMNFFFSSRRRHTFFFQAEDGIRDRSPSRGLGDVYKRQSYSWLFSILSQAQTGGSSRVDLERRNVILYMDSNTFEIFT